MIALCSVAWLAVHDSHRPPERGPVPVPSGAVQLPSCRRANAAIRPPIGPGPCRVRPPRPGRRARPAADVSAARPSRIRVDLMARAAYRDTAHRAAVAALRRPPYVLVRGPATTIATSAARLAPPRPGAGCLRRCAGLRPCKCGAGGASRRAADASARRLVEVVVTAEFLGPVGGPPLPPVLSPVGFMTPGFVVT